MFRASLLTSCLLLAGCAAAAPLMSTDPLQTTNAGVTAIASLDIRDDANRRIMTTGLQPWVKASIDHVTLSISRDGAGSPAALVSVVQVDLTKNVTFTNLIRNQLYHVVAKAWSDAGEATEIDNLANVAASCTTNFTTTTAVSINIGPLALQLRNKVFSGSTTGSTVTVTDGSITDTTATEAATVGP